MVRGYYMKWRYALIATFLMVIAVFFGLPASGAGTMGYSDPVGDLDNEGMPSDVIANVDIVEVSVDDSGDPIIVELKVDGIIDYEETYDHERLYYHYHVNFDTNGDNDRDCWVEIDSNANTYVFHVPDSSDMEDLTGMFSGQNTSTLRVEVTKAWFAGESIVDVSAETTVGDLMDYCDDDVNEDFEGGTPIGGDDDKDDDTTDDDTTDDDTTDDDTTDDDTSDDDDDEDTPGFGLFVIISSVVTVFLITAVFGRKRK